MVSEHMHCSKELDPQGVWGSGENGYLFSGSWGALVIILGEQTHSFGDLWSNAKRQKNKIKEKPPFCLILSKFLLLLPQTPL